MTLIKAGDKVRFLNEIGGGVVTGIIDDKIAKLVTEDGFEMPVMLNELVKIERQGVVTIKKEEKTAPIENTLIELNNSKGEYEKNPEVNLIFALVLPNNIFKWNNILTYLINDSNYESYYIIGYQASDKIKYISSGLLESNTKVLIDEFKMDELFNYDNIVIQQILFNTNEFHHLPSVEKSINAKNLTVLKNKDFIVNDYFNESAYIIEINSESNLKELTSLSKEELSRILQEKMMEKKNNKPLVTINKKSDNKNNFEEIDLHIHEIIDDYHDLSNGEIVRIQLDRFETTLESAIINKTKKIVFIHGVGNGSLKLEIRKLLDKKYPDITYQDASFKEYGYGATMLSLVK